MSLVKAKQNDEVMAEINITPFTDVLLVLLIIFMILAALVTPPGFQKQLPNANNAPPTQAKKQKEIDVTVTSKGVIFVDQARTDATGVYNAMRDAVSAKGKVHVSITADTKAPYGTIIRILDAAQQSDLEDVGFVTS